MATASQLVLVRGRFQHRPPPSPWEKAKSRFLEGLEPEERKLFHEATPENLLYSTSNAEKFDARDSKVRATLNKINPLVSAIEDYGKAVDVYAQIEPIYLSPVWGSIRVILVMASTHNKFYSRMIEVLGQIGDLLPRFGEFERLFSLSLYPRFAEALTKAYVDVIEVCSDFKKALREQKTSLLKRAFQPLSQAANQKFEEAITRFRAHKKAVEKEAELCHMIEEKKSREIVLRDKAEAEMRLKLHRQKDLVSKLSDLDNRRKHRQMQRARLGGTGTWALERFKDWTKELETSIMCCTGIPGSGKSILASQFVDEALANKEASSPKVAFFYCDYAEKRTLEPPRILSNICQQLLCVLEICPQPLLDTVETLYRHSQQPDLDDTVDLLKEILKDFTNAIVFIDGIDELSEKDQKDLLKKLWNILSEPTVTGIKVFVSSREAATNLVKPSGVQSINVIHLSENQIANDIDCFVKISVDQAMSVGDLIVGESSLRQEIIAALMEGSKGMFLWVKFQILDLCSAHSDNDIRSRLRNMPRSLSETYDRLLSHIAKDVLLRTHIRRMFYWLTCARRPMTVDEMREAIAFDTGDQHYDAGRLPNDMSRLSRACGHLVIIDEETQTVQFAHYTVQQYLLEFRNSPSDVPCQYTLSEADDSVGLVCLTYLSFSDFERQITVFRDRGVTAGFEAMERVVVDPFNSNVTQKLSQSLSRLRGVSELKPTRIDYARHASRPHDDKEVQDLNSKYKLLAYVAEHWLEHASGISGLNLPNTFGGEPTLVDLLFYNVVFRINPPFEFRPWDGVDVESCKFPFLVHLGVALESNHYPLICFCMNRRSELIEKLWDDCWQRLWAWLRPLLKDSSFACQLFFDTEKFGEENREPHPSERNWEGWLFYRILLASARSDIRALKFLLDDCIRCRLAETSIMLGVILLQATIHSWTSTAEYICLAIADWEPKYVMNVWRRALWKDLKCDTYVLAHLLDFETVSYAAVFMKHRSLRLRSFLDEFSSGDYLENAIAERKTDEVKGYLRALGMSYLIVESINFDEEVYSTSPEKESADRNAFAEALRMNETSSIFTEESTIVPESQHWTVPIPDLTLFDKLDFLLAAGTVPKTEDASLALKITIENRDNDNPSFQEDNRDAKRVERILRVAGAGCANPNAWMVFGAQSVRVRKLLRSCKSQDIHPHPINYAILYDRFEIAKTLILSTAFDEQDHFVDVTPFHCAILVGNFDMLKFIHDSRKLPYKVNDTTLKDMDTFAIKYWPTRSRVPLKTVRDYLRQRKFKVTPILRNQPDQWGVNISHWLSNQTWRDPATSPEDDTRMIIE